MGATTPGGGRGTDEGGGRRNRGEGGGFGQGGGGGRGQGGGGGRGGDPNSPEFRARQMERFKNMSSDEQTQFIERMKSRGQDASEYEKLMPKKKAAPKTAMQSKYGSAQTGETIDALFAPIPTVETSGRAWLYIDKQLKQVSLRLGISDGTQTELLSGELQPNMELVTGVIMGSTRPAPTGPGSGNPLMPGGGRGPGGFGGPGGGGRGGGR